MSNKPTPSPVKPSLPLSLVLLRLSCSMLLGLAIFAFSRAKSDQAVHAVPDYRSLKPTKAISSQPEKVLGLKFVVVE